ncbi:MAG: glutamate--cysteine ligase [Thermoleophilia bacterium]|nr:glutamate--cysteine ligase [Thermoleophilia bacterium]
METNFGSSDLYSLGIEEEFQILDGETLRLVPRVDELLASIGRSGGERAREHVTHELFQSEVEISTGVAGSVAEAVEELAYLRGRLRAAAASRGALIASAGTHPFSSYEWQEVTEERRYLDLLETMRWVAERGLVFGLHVHVGLDSAERAIACANGLRAALPELLALSANSPFWHGRATGLASTRAKVFEGFPRSGVPPAFDSFADFERLVERGVRTNSFPDYTYIWWDVRPHPRLGTVELRVCDAQTRLSSVAALAALAQSLVATVVGELERGERAPAEPQTLLEENKWRALRDGLDAVLIDLATDTERPAREAVAALAERCAPAAAALGCVAELDGVGAILARGNGADEQRRVHGEHHSIRAVARWLADETVCLPKLRPGASR